MISNAQYRIWSPREMASSSKSPKNPDVATVNELTMQQHQSGNGCTRAVSTLYPSGSAVQRNGFVGHCPPSDDPLKKRSLPWKAHHNVRLYSMGVGWAAAPTHGESRNAYDLPRPPSAERVRSGSVRTWQLKSQVQRQNVFEAQGKDAYLKLTC